MDMDMPYLLLMVLGLQHFVSCLSDSLIVRSFLFRAWTPPWSGSDGHSGFASPLLFLSDEEWLFVLRTPHSLDSLHSRGDHFC